MPSSSAYMYRFGSLLARVPVGRVLRQYATTVTWSSTRFSSAAAPLRCSARVEGRVGRARWTHLPAIRPQTSLMSITNSPSPWFLARCQRNLQATTCRWKIRFDTGLAPDITVAVRLNPSNDKAMDYYLLPWIEFARVRLEASRNRMRSKSRSFRFETLRPTSTAWRPQNPHEKGPHEPRCPLIVT